MLLDRALSAVVIVVTTALFVYLGGIPFALFVAGISLVAARELCRMFDRNGFPPLILATLAQTLALILDAYFRTGLAVPIILLGVLVPLLWQLLPKQSSWQGVMNWALTPLAALYIGLPMSYFVLLRELTSQQGVGGLPNGLWWTVFAILSTWAADAGAYVVGTAFGRHSFVARISPRKTWEGVAGAIAWTMVVGIVMAVWVLGLPALYGAILGVLIAIVAILGDLAESLIKRGTKVKDTGKILPGHGGMLDRLDTLIFVGPLVYYFAKLVM